MVPCKSNDKCNKYLIEAQVLTIIHKLIKQSAFRDMRLALLTVAVILLTSSVAAKKKKKSDKSLFDGKTLNCLVCRSIVDEIETAINKVDPAKKVEVGTFRLNGDGTQNRKLVRNSKNI